MMQTKNGPGRACQRTGAGTVPFSGATCSPISSGAFRAQRIFCATDSGMIGEAPVTAGFPPVKRVGAANGHIDTPGIVRRALRPGNRPSRPVSRPSLRSAIDGFCRQCIFDPLAPGRWREQVAACCDGGCSLHAVRAMPKGVAPGSPELAQLRARLEPRPSQAGDAL